MSYDKKLLNQYPKVYLPLNETSGLVATDASTFHNNFTYSTQANANFFPLVRNGGKGQLFSGSKKVTGTISLDTWDALSSNQPFVLDIWVNPKKLTAERFVVGRGTNNGLYINKSGFVFKLNSMSGLQQLFFPVPRMVGSFHVAVVYTGDTITLYVNGQSVTMETLGQISSAGSTAMTICDGNLGSDQLLIGHFGYFTKPISQKVIVDRKDDALKHNSFIDAIVQDQGVLFLLDDSGTDVVLEIQENTLEDFKKSITFSNLYYDKQLGVLTNSDPTAIGIREVAYSISELGVVDGSRIDWDSDSQNLLTQTSVDNGTTWQTPTNHAELPGISAGTDLTDKILRIRQTFGISPDYDIPTLRSNRIIIYDNRNPKALNSDEELEVNGFIKFSEQVDDAPLYQSSISLASLDANSYLVLPAPTEQDIVGIEYLVRRDNGDNGASLPTTTGLELWLDANQINGAGNAQPASGALISTWKDLSGNGRDLIQSTAGQKPQFQANGVEELPAVSFDGVDDNMHVTVPVGVLAKQQRTVYVVLVSTPRAATTAILSGNSSEWYVGEASNGRMISSIKNAAGAQSTITGAAGSEMNTAAVYTYINDVPAFNDATKTVIRKFYKNGTNYLNNSQVIGEQAPTGTTLYLGALGAGTSATDMTVAAVLYYSIAHDDATRAEIETYLENKYAVGSDIIEGTMIDTRFDGGTEYFEFDQSGNIRMAGWSKVFINGIQKTPVREDFPANAEVLVTLIPTNPISTGIKVNGNAGATVGTYPSSTLYPSSTTFPDFSQNSLGITGAYQYFTVYHNTLSDIAPLRHFLAATGVKTITFGDTDTVVLSETGWDAYNYAWQQ